MKYRKLEIVPDKGFEAGKKEKKKASTFPPKKKLTPEEKEQMKSALMKASDNGTKPLPDIPSKMNESEKTQKLMAAPDEIIAKGIQTMLDKDREARGDE